MLTMPSTAIRPGQPGTEAAFGEAYAAAGGAVRLGQPLGEVREETCGWVQHFDGGQSGEPAVICALYGRQAMAVAGSVWQALGVIGDASRGGGTAGVGFRSMPGCRHRSSVLAARRSCWPGAAGGRAAWSENRRTAGHGGRKSRSTARRAEIVTRGRSATRTWICGCGSPPVFRLPGTACASPRPEGRACSPHSAALGSTTSSEVLRGAMAVPAGPRRCRSGWRGWRTDR